MPEGKPTEVKPPDEDRDEPPRRERASRTRDTRRPGRPPGSQSVKHIEDGLNQFFGGVSIVFLFSGDAYMAELFSVRGPNLAKAYANLARQNPAVKKLLERLIAGGQYGEVVFTTLSIVLPAMSHYRVIPPIPPIVPFAFESESERMVREAAEHAASR